MIRDKTCFNGDHSRSRGFFGHGYLLNSVPVCSILPYQFRKSFTNSFTVILHASISSELRDKEVEGSPTSSRVRYRNLINEDTGVKDFESWLYRVHDHHNYPQHDRWH